MKRTERETSVYKFYRLAQFKVLFSSKYVNPYNETKTILTFEFLNKTVRKIKRFHAKIRYLYPFYKVLYFHII